MRTFLRFFSAVALLALCARGLTAADKPYIGPYVQAVTQDSAVILWETDDPAVGEVEVGESIASPVFFRESDLKQIHAVRATGLLPDTRYYYRARWDGKTSERFAFHTLPPTGSRRFRMCVYGDSRSNPPVHAEIVRRMIPYEPAIVLHTGDLVVDGSKRENWKPQFFEPLEPLAANVPVVPCIGNHEKDSSFYYNYFNLPSASKESWFSYRWANVHFIVLDSQKELKPDSRQTKWLEEELKTPDPDWRIVFCHYPMFSCHPSRDVNENRWAWQDLFDKYGVDLVLTGHDHYYHRTHRIGRAWDKKSKGVYHITTAGGGAPLYAVENKVYTAFAESVHHFLVLDIDGKTLSGQAIAVDGRVIDTFTIDRTKPETTPFVSYEMILWEKELREAVEKIQPEPVIGSHGRVERKFTLPTLFETPNRVAFRWVGGSSFWALDLCEGIVNVQGKKPFEPTLWGEGPIRTMYPLPRLEITALGRSSASRDYVNRTLSIQPLKLSANQSVRAPKFMSKITVDGKLNEPEWATAGVASGLTRDYGRIVSERETFHVGYDDDGIVFGARIRSFVEKPTEIGAKDHDTKHMFRTDEAVTVVLSPPLLKQVYAVLSGNSRGTKFDSLNNLLQWEPKWEFAASATENGWSAEGRIPWIALGIPGPSRQAWKVNFFRWDTKDKALSEWAPTFSAFGTNRKQDGTITFE